MKAGLFGGVGLHWVATIFIVIELCLVINQLFRCLEWPKDNKGLWYLFLLTSLLTYNVIGNFFPSTQSSVPLIVQYILHHCSILIVSAYCTFYFYKSFGLTILKFHIKYGIWAFLIAPYLLGFISCYFLTNNLVLSVRVAMPIPTIYTFILVFIIGKAVYEKYKKEPIRNFKDVLLLCLALLMWAVITFLITADIGKFHELILSNATFLIFFILNIKNQFRKNRTKEAIFQSMATEIAHFRSITDAGTKEISEINSSSTRRNSSIFDENCKKYLTQTQTEIVKQANQGVKYNEIAELRGVSEDYIKGVMSEIGKRLEVKGRGNILRKLRSKN